MIDTDTWISCVNDTFLHSWLNEQTANADQIITAHGDYSRWRESIARLSDFKTGKVDFTLARIAIGQAGLLTEEQEQTLKQLLLNFHPWRKGPFDIFGIHIDSEWRSDLKWQRLSDCISSLDGRRVLDVGCGNGYYMLRMLGAGAEWVLGIDPTVLFYMQFYALTQLISSHPNAYSLPLGIDDLPDNLGFFDTVFSMGVLYHRRSPIDHLYKLLSCLRPGGELVLETLIIEGSGDQLLLPENRYAKMRNIWFIPTPAALERWLRRCGFINVQTADVSATSLDEQRSTEWMRFESLKDFLDPDDLSKTVEGLPAPKRAILVARRPD